LLERIEGESFGLFCPDPADVFVRRETFKGLKPLGEVVGADEIGKMAAQLVVRFVVEALDGGILDGAAHPLDLAVGPGMLGLGQAMIDIVAGAGHVEGVSPEWFLSFDHGVDIGHSPTPTAWIGEVGAVVRQNGVDLVGDCLDQVPQEVGCDTPRSFLVQLHESELRGSIDGDEEIEPSHRSANLGDIDVEVSDRITLELAPCTLAILHVVEAVRYRGAEDSDEAMNVSNAGLSLEGHGSSHPAAATYACERRR